MARSYNIHLKNPCSFLSTTKIFAWFSLKFLAHRPIVFCCLLIFCIDQSLLREFDARILVKLALPKFNLLFVNPLCRLIRQFASQGEKWRLVRQLTGHFSAGANWTDGNLLSTLFSKSEQSISATVWR